MGEHAGYVVAGYALTAGALVAYTAWLWQRIRRAERSLPDGDRD